MRLNPNLSSASVNTFDGIFVIGGLLFSSPQWGASRLSEEGLKRSFVFAMAAS